MVSSVRGSTAFGLTVALAVGVAAGSWLAGSGNGDVDAGRESWLFSHTADAGEIREAGDGSLELVLRSFDSHVTAFTDRPHREAKIEPIGWLVSLWDELFVDSPPNAVLAEHDPESIARSVVVELESPRLSDGELVYAITVLDDVPNGRLARVAGEMYDNPVRSFRNVSVFIDDVSLSCAQGGTCVVGDIGPGGGKVFSVSSTGSYLEAATSDLGYFDWWDAQDGSTGYRGGGQKNWRLPSLSELKQMYGQRSVIGGFGAISYWTSTAGDDSLSKYVVCFCDGGQSVVDTSDNVATRPIRTG